MKRVLAVVLLGCLVVAGCGVWMNSDYAQRLDETVAWSADMSRRAELDSMTSDEMKAALKSNSELWRLFKEARDGVAPQEDN